MSSQIIKLATFLVGLFFFLEFVFPDPFFGVSLPSYSQFVLQGITGIAVISLGLGLISVTTIHGGKVLRASTGWIYSAALLLSLFAMVFLQSVDWYLSAQNAKRVDALNNLADFAVRIRTDASRPGSLGVAERNQFLFGAAMKLGGDFENAAVWEERYKATPKDEASQTELNSQLEQELRDSIPLLQKRLDTPYKASAWRRAFNLMFEGLFVPLGAAMFGLLGFYIAAAAYKAFRVRSVESSLMMIAAMLVILGQTPFGALLWDGFGDVRLWLLEVPSKGAFRAIRIGAGVAALVLAFRIWCSIEGKGVSRGRLQ